MERRPQATRFYPRPLSQGGHGDGGRRARRARPSRPGARTRVRALSFGRGQDGRLRLHDRRENAPLRRDGDPRKMRAVDGVGRGELAVWSGEGKGVCFFGELIALGMKRRGCAGALVDGGHPRHRMDQATAISGLRPVPSPVQSIGRWKVTAWQVPVDIRARRKSAVRVRRAISFSPTRDGRDRDSGARRIQGAGRGRAPDREGDPHPARPRPVARAWKMC